MFSKKIIKGSIIFMLSMCTAGCSGDSKNIPKPYTDKINTDEIASQYILEDAIDIKSVDVDRYIMDLTLDTDKKQLSGEVIMNITNNSDDTLNRIGIRFYAASVLNDSTKSQIESIYIKNTDEKLSFEVKDDPSVIYADLSNHELAPKASISLKVKYFTEIPKREDRFGYYQKKEKTNFQLSFCFPSIAMYENGSWNENPFIDLSAETSSSKVSDYEITLQAPKEYLVVASGDETQKGSVTKIKGKDIRDMAIVASNNMRVESSKVKGVKINHYVLDYENLKDYNRVSMQATSDAVTLFTNIFGKYPYKELDVVQVVGTTRMEYPGLLMIGYGDTPPNINEAIWGYLPLCSSIAHEVAHEWFYATVGNNQYEEAWLDEGLSEFCEDILYLQSGSKSIIEAIELDNDNGTDHNYLISKKDFKEMQKQSIELMTDKKINLAFNQYNQDEYSNYVYDRGSLFFYELRNEMGDKTFFSMLRDYYETYYLKEAKSIDMIQAILAYDDSDKIKEIIERYLDTE